MKVKILVKNDYCYNAHKDKPSDLHEYLTDHLRQTSYGSGLVESCSERISRLEDLVTCLIVSLAERGNKQIAEGALKNLNSYVFKDVEIIVEE